MPRQCIFCGRTPVTKEHIFGSWLSPLFPTPQGKQMYIDRDTLIQGQPIMKTRRYPLSLDLQVKRVCFSCNGGWMSKLEEDAMKIIPAIYEGTKKSITNNEQSILASWGTKTAIVIQYIDNKSPVPLRRRRWVFNNHTSPPDTYVWIARYDGKGIASILSKDLFIEGNPKFSGHPNGQLVFFSIGSIFFAILCLYTKNVGYRIEFPIPIAKNIFQIWPTNGQDIFWPQMGIDDSMRANICNISNWDFILRFFHLPKAP